ncbi:endonuclease/exonuclease/phosphatase family protein [Streptomyces sp. NPDC054975]
MKKRVWGVLGAALLALSGAPAQAAPAPAASMATPPPGTNLQVMNWNMCGVKRWGCEGTGTAAQKNGLVKQYVQSHYVQAVLLQEICASGLDQLMADLGPGWSKNFVPYAWSQNGVRTASVCSTEAGADPKDLAGTAIVIKAGLADAKEYPRTQPVTGLNPPLQCATATYFGVRLCNAHVVTKPNPYDAALDLRDEQLAELKQVVSQNPKVVFGGDFNTQPPDTPGLTRTEIDKWPTDLYSKGEGTPGYQECDQQGSARTGRVTTDGGWKLDYLFSSEARRWCLVADAKQSDGANLSDHHVVIESVMITPPAG